MATTQPNETETMTTKTNKTNKTILTANEAIDYAETNGVSLNKYADPTEEERSGLDVDEAREIAREDPGLIWVELAEQRA